MSDFGLAAAGHTPALVLGYAQMPEDSIRAGIRQLAKAVRATHPE